MSDSRLPRSTRVRVPAKVNLFLAVRRRLADGMHEIVSVMHSIGLHDLVTVELVGPEATYHHPAVRRHMQVDLDVDDAAGVPSDESNLVLRAARELADELGFHPELAGPDDEDVPVTRLSLSKDIPIAAGMAGGSADAAATLVALNRLWRCELDREELQEVAARIGADVPFCLSGGTALATGTGVATAQVLCRGTFHWVVGIDRLPLSTADVYAQWDRTGHASEVEPDAVLHALRTRDPEALGAALHNDLAPAAVELRPVLEQRLRAMREAGALGAVVSGSGPTVVALAEDEVHARRIAREVRDLFDRVETATSPAGGPEVLQAVPG